jgi:transposase-like protein
MPSYQGRHHLPRKTRARLYALLDSGLSYTKVAARLGCHRNTVYLAAKARRLAASAGERISNDDSAERTRRCEGCGALCDMPCVACAAREALGS